MAKGINISVASDTRDFIKGIRNGVIEPLDDASDTLRDLADTGDDAGRDLSQAWEKSGDSAASIEASARRAGRTVESSMDDAADAVDDLGREGDRAADRLEDAMKDAQGDTDKLDAAYKDLGDTIRATSKKAGSELGSDVKRGTTEGSEALGEFKDESRSIAQETATSFDGTAESITDVFRDLAATAFAGFGPAGLVAGVAVAAGIGLGVKAGEDLAEQINEARERAGELASELLDVDGDLSQIDWASRMRDWGLEVKDSREWWELWQDTAITNLDAVRDAARDAGVDWKDAFTFASGAGSPEDAAAMVDKLTESIEAETAALEAAAPGRDEYGRLNAQVAIDTDDSINAKQDLIDMIEKEHDVTAQGIEDARALREATEAQKAADEAAAASIEARADALDALQSPIDDAIGSYAEFQDAESGALDPSGYIESIRKRREATSGFADNVASLAEEFGLSVEEQQAILDQGLEFAPMLQSIIDSGMSDEFVGEVQAGLTGGQDALDKAGLNTTVDVDANTKDAESGISTTTKKPRNTTIKTSADVLAASRSLSNTTGKKRTATIGARASTSSADRDIDRVAAARRTATIDVQAAVNSATTALSNFINRPRTAVVTASVRDRQGRYLP
ncbi:hypothetical protein D9V30_00610 [Mycetocola reblochoni]|uniref:Uncharacterized protein n=2 Tax=Mycetocola reblochoni TaxID=331618 RepID=A0A1R4IW52_9MICO|nr:hypothetical protein [Mycetocola reblochoni]RLP70968.1 hypothetical protein D9V30_00610 [Mycetocola reblochoni]SJN24111.1 hypothetical protein FM119_04015 [Mycetocola reblochoni REB411]